MLVQNERLNLCVSQSSEGPGSGALLAVWLWPLSPACLTAWMAAGSPACAPGSWTLGHCAGALALQMGQCCCCGPCCYFRGWPLHHSLHRRVFFFCFFFVRCWRRYWWMWGWGAKGKGARFGWGMVFKWSGSQLLAMHTKGVTSTYANVPTHTHTHTHTHTYTQNDRDCPLLCSNC